MNRPITLSLAIVVLAHSLAGCCSHHAHASVLGEANACSTHEHEHGHSDDGTKSDSPGQPCDEGSCVFVRGDGSPSVEMTLVLALDCCAATADKVALDSLRIARAAYPDSQELAPHTRIHLLHQILLI